MHKGLEKERRCQKGCVNFESMPDLMKSNIDSGATPIGSVDRAPDEIIKGKEKTHVITNLEVLSKGVLVDACQINVFHNPASRRTRRIRGRNDPRM